MGNNIGITQILNKHKKLSEKESDSNYPDVDLLFFNMPITFEYPRQHKSYIEQISQSTDNELSNTKYNELYLHKYKVIITHNDVKTNIEKPLEEYFTMTIPSENIIFYKHFDFIEDEKNEKNELDELDECFKNIDDYENQINSLKLKIINEKQKILNLDYIKSKLNRQIPNIKEYIRTINNLKKIC